MSVYHHKPLVGTPIEGLDEIASIADNAGRMAAAALSVDGPGLTVTAGATSLSLARKLPVEAKLFQICTCWTREKPLNAPGATKGTWWTCKGIPVGYWHDWTAQEGGGGGSGGSGGSGGPSSGSGDGEEAKDDYFWQALIPGDYNSLTDLWWPLIGHEYQEPASAFSESSASSGSGSVGSISGSGSGTCGSGFVSSSAPSPSSSGSSGSGSSSSAPPCDDTPENPDWQKALYPKFGPAQWVWAVKEYASGVWRVLDAYDPIVRFVLEEPIKGCQPTKARAFMIDCGDVNICGGGGGSCGSGFVSSSASASPSVSSVSNQSPPSSSAPSSLSTSTGGCGSGVSVSLPSTSHAYASSSGVSAESSSGGSLSASASQHSHGSASVSAAESSSPSSSVSNSSPSVSSLSFISSQSVSSMSFVSSPASISSGVSSCSGGFSVSLGSSGGSSGSSGSGSSSGGSSGSKSGSTSGSGSLSSSSSQPKPHCHRGLIYLSAICVTDRLGIAKAVFPKHGADKGICGWAKRCADSMAFEVLSLGDCRATAGSSSGSGSSAPSGSVSGSATSSHVSRSGSGSGTESSSGSSVPSSKPPSGSSKSSAIVPAAFSPTGYTALFVEEAPEVRFNDVMVMSIPMMREAFATIDPKFLAVCDDNTLEVAGWSTDIPILVGAQVDGNMVRIRFPEDHPEEKVRLVLRFTGIRRGFSGLRFPDRTEEQFEANERFIKMAYAN